MSKVAAIGIDVGGTKTRLALFDSSFEVVKNIKVKTPKDKAAFQKEIEESVKKLKHEAVKQSLAVSAIGVGFAGSVDSSKGVVRSAPNIPDLENFSFAKVLGPFADNVTLHNDVHSALYGEMKLGAAAGYKHIIGVFIGTGIGGAIALDGKLHLGATGEAGNIGHYLLQPFGPLAGSERHGILDDAASRLAIAGTAATFAAKRWAPNLLKDAGTDVLKIKSSELSKAIKAGDKSIEELVKSRAHIVGIVLSNMVDFFNPEMVVLGGGLTEAMPKLIREEVAAGIREHATEQALFGLKVVTAKLKDHAVTTGAAKLALNI